MMYRGGITPPPGQDGDACRRVGNSLAGRKDESPKRCQSARSVRTSARLKSGGCLGAPRIHCYSGITRKSPCIIAL